MTTNIQLFGRIVITASINTLTGLHIGGTSASMEIGGVDNTIIRNPINNQPYIPGSVCAGKCVHRQRRSWDWNKTNGSEVMYSSIPPEIGEF
jgi:CRISPR-associated protein Csm3